MSNKKLTLEELEYVQKEVNTNTKSLPVAYLLAIFLGPFGIHRAYFGKKKSAILKAIVSLFGATAFLMIILNMTTLDLNARITGEILANYATLAIAFVLPTLISGIWSVVDLFLIPKWKRTWDENNKNKAVEEVVQARYVKGQILRKELTEELIKQAKLDTINEIKRIVDDLDKEELNKLNVVKMPKLPEISEIEEEIHDDKLSDNNVEEIENEEEIYDDELSDNNVEIEEEIYDDKLSDNNVEISKDDHKASEVVYETENQVINEEKIVNEEVMTNVQNAIDDNNGIKSVTGYIIGSIETNTQKIITSNFSDDTNIILADNADETDENKMLFIKISRQGKFKESIGLRSQPNNLGKKIELKGVLGSYFGKPGMKKLSAFDIKD